MISAFKAVDRVVAEALGMRGNGGHRVVDLTAQAVLAVVQARDWFCGSIHSFKDVTPPFVSIALTLRKSYTYKLIIILLSQIDGVKLYGAIGWATPHQMD